ncbi:MAG TPA: hypothetical protein VJX67_20020 [Blastocatellia bacterium]|nr:hypothetical protein [Blastocatellia bacterium]
MIKSRIANAGLVLTASLFVIAAVSGRTPPSQTTQEIYTLDRRISAVEQRIYGIESNINRLQQASAIHSTPSEPTHDPELTELRLQMDQLRQRINQIECGLVKLDERTLPKGKSAVPASGRPKDPCRTEPDTPVQLPSRPN